MTSTAPLSAAQILARLVIVDGAGSGQTADITMARRSFRARPGPSHDPYSGGIAAAAISPDAIRARAIFGA